MKMTPLLIFMTLPAIGLADYQVSFCAAVAKDQSGDLSLASCNVSYYPLVASINGSGNQIDVSLLNYVYGSADSPAGTTIDFTLVQAAFVSQKFIVEGGSGSGMLLFGGFSDAGCFVCGAGFGLNQSISFTSNFLPSPRHYMGAWGTSYGNPIEVPFVFGEPLTLSFSSNIQVWPAVPFSKNSYYWELLQQWDAHLEEIVDANGNPVPAASISAVPEPSSIMLLVTAVIGVELIRRRRIH
jgi:hypothetical protein